MWVLATNRSATKSSVVRAHAGPALAAAALRAVGRDRHALDVAAVGHGDDHVLALDQVLDVLLELVASRSISVRRGVANCSLISSSSVRITSSSCVAERQHLEIARDHPATSPQLVGDLVALQPGQALQAQLQDRAGLGVGQPVGALGG